MGKWGNLMRKLGEIDGENEKSMGKLMGNEEVNGETGKLMGKWGD